MRNSYWLGSLMLAFALGFVSHQWVAAESPARVTGIGGVFFKSKDPAALKAWYAGHLGMPMDEYGARFEWKSLDAQPGVTQWSVMPAKTNYFAPSSAPFMINYRVTGLSALVTRLRAEGVQVLDEIEVTSYGSFVHVLDPDENKDELWEAS